MFQQAIISALADQQRVRWQHPSGAYRRTPTTGETMRAGYRSDTEMAASGHESTASWADPSCPLGTSRVSPPSAQKPSSTLLNRSGETT